METEQVSYANPQDQTLPGRTVAVSRTLLYAVLALLVSATVWAAVTRVDVVVDARGRLVVEGEPLKISVPEPGIVADVRARTGDHVTAGQVLLRLDPYHYDATEARLAADIDAATADANRYRLKATAAPDTPAAAADAELQAAAFTARARSLREQLAETRESRAHLTLLAPAAGTITHTAALHPGITIAPTEPAITLMPDDVPLVAIAKIPNASMRRLRSGADVRITFDALPREDYGDLPGRLTKLAPDADDLGFYRAWVALDRTDLRGPLGTEKLRAGLELHARVVIERRSILTLVLSPLRRLSQPMTVTQ